MSHPSSPCADDRVNDDPATLRQARYHRQSLRRILAIERQLRAFTPRPMLIPPEKPAKADRVLDALARAYPPGTRISIAEISAATGIGRTEAFSVRRWARSAGLWPYRPSLTGFAALADSKRKGGAQ